MSDRAKLIEWTRSELVGPSRPMTGPALVAFVDREFADSVPLRRGPLAWRPSEDGEAQEVLYYERESPHRKYGAGLLHPAWASAANLPPDEAALRDGDTVGAEPESDETSESGAAAENPDSVERDPDKSALDGADDFEVTSADVRHPSTIGISFCAVLNGDGQLTVRIPQHQRFAWQTEVAPPFSVNGRYESCTRRWTDNKGQVREAPIWRRLHAVLPNAAVTIDRSELAPGRVIGKDLPMTAGSPLNLRIEVFPRRLQGRDDAWLLTVVIRNSTEPCSTRVQETVLYQTLFDVTMTRGHFEPYPESRRPFAQLDSDEQSLALLYRDSVTWAIGHGCAAGWNTGADTTPMSLYVDVMPAVELPSMTPDIELNGSPVQLSMRALSALSDDGMGPAWQSLADLATGYAVWIRDRRSDATNLSPQHTAVATLNLDACEACLSRINAGIALLRNDARVRRAFRLANLAMLLQQIATKQLPRRPLNWNATLKCVEPKEPNRPPWTIYDTGTEDKARLGSWRAFQIAFLLMSLEGVSNGRSAEREIVDLIWFPTGGGKTEAYLAVMAFYLFHERLLVRPNGEGLRRDGTNVLMRYTLRMLTTQQFQRAASLICAMEYLRRNAARHAMGDIPGERFSLGLWVGGAGSPNKIREARIQLQEFRRDGEGGNPLVLTECPWCRAEIGRFNAARPQFMHKSRWNALATRGITDDPVAGPRLHCSDPHCEFGREQPQHWLPVEVIDERIYQHPPSVVIATVDKLAMMSYRPEAGPLFGRRFVAGEPQQVAVPPGLIIQDELHLISGPLGSMYALYEGIFERLCSFGKDGTWIKPKLVASTATIRGATEQVKTLYARSMTRLFPSPGLLMGDSFFGKYARDKSGKLREGRLYVGIHASDYGSVLTTQVRAFSSALFRPWGFVPQDRDPWWTLLAFYNSIRELGGAKTLFDSDIRSRLKFMFNREGFPHDARRNLRIVEELTSRLTQPEIVRMMDRLSAPYGPSNTETLDACLASNIIEVGVDIERLSLMGVVGQPKTTATYIQVTGRVGRRWWERPGLIFMIYNPSKSRDRSHFEQFHSYHRRLYERVEPTTATPYAISAIQRGLPGALLAWARQHSQATVNSYSAYAHPLDEACRILRARCVAVQLPEDQTRSLAELQRVRDDLQWKWQQNPQLWEEFPPKVTDEYLMLWPGQFATPLQKARGVVVPSSMRQVDRSAELTITQGYAVAAIRDPEENVSRADGAEGHPDNS
jgi:hypothetical protein